MLHLHAHPIQYLGLSGGGGTGLSANKGDTEWLPSDPGDRSALLGTLCQVGHPGQSWSGVPDLSPPKLPAEHKSLGAPQEVGALQAGVQTDLRG